MAASKPKKNKSPKRQPTPNPGAISPQAALVLDYLSSEPGRELTPLIAHMTLGIASLTSRIAELRKLKGPDGRAPKYDLRGEWKNDHFGRRYMAYWLVIPKQPQQ